MITNHSTASTAAPSLTELREERSLALWEAQELERDGFADDARDAKRRAERLAALIEARRSDFATAA